MLHPKLAPFVAPFCLAAAAVAQCDPTPTGGHLIGAPGIVFVDDDTATANGWPAAEGRLRVAGLRSSQETPRQLWNQQGRPPLAPGSVPWGVFPVTSFSSGMDYIASTSEGVGTTAGTTPGWAALLFSVSEGASILPESVLAAEKNCGGVGGDLFQYVWPDSEADDVEPFLDGVIKVVDSTSMYLADPNGKRAEITAFDPYTAMALTEWNVFPNAAVNLKRFFFTYSNADAASFAALHNLGVEDGSTVFEAEWDAVTNSYQVRVFLPADPNRGVITALAVDIGQKYVLYAEHGSTSLWFGELASASAPSSITSRIQFQVEIPQEAIPPIVRPIRDRLGLGTQPLPKVHIDAIAAIDPRVPDFAKFIGRQAPVAVPSTMIAGLVHTPVDPVSPPRMAVCVSEVPLGVTSLFYYMKYPTTQPVLMHTATLSGTAETDEFSWPAGAPLGADMSVWVVTNTGQSTPVVGISH